MGDHTEAFQLDFNPARVSYAELLELFWAAHNPTRKSHSIQYMAAVLTEGDEQQRLAIDSRARMAEKLGREVHTRLAPLTRFFRAEDYHQKYILRRRDDFTREFEPAYDAHAFTDSTVAARLNGYLGGHGSVAQLEGELDSFGLSAEARTRLQTVVRSTKER